MAGFDSRIVSVLTLDGRNVKLAKPVTYTARDGRVFIIPEGTMSDGASTPSAMWSLLPPFGDYWLPAILHDAAYRNTLLEDINGLKVTADLPKLDCDNLLKEAMEICGVDAPTIETIYEGVKFGGWRSYRDDRK